MILRNLCLYYTEDFQPLSTNRTISCSLFYGPSELKKRKVARSAVRATLAPWMSDGTMTYKSAPSSACINCGSCLDRLNVLGEPRPVGGSQPVVALKPAIVAAWPLPAWKTKVLLPVLTSWKACP